jgi:hypothetical protein
MHQHQLRVIDLGKSGGIPVTGGHIVRECGIRTTEAKRRPRKRATPTDTSPAAAQVGVQHSFTMHATPAPDVHIEDAVAAAPAALVEPGATPAPAGAAAAVLAKPPVRKLAKDLGVDLGAVVPTGDGGTITRDDVNRHASDGGVSVETTAAPARVVVAGERETRLPIKGVRKVTAQAMVASAFTAPHVTEWITVDATRTMKMVGRLRERREFRDVKVSPLLVVARAVCVAVRRVAKFEEGEPFDFLGYTFRWVDQRKDPGKKMVLARPQKKKRTRLLRELGAGMRRLLHVPIAKLVQEYVNPRVAGWVNAFRWGSSGRDLSYVRWQVDKKVRCFASRQQPKRRGGRSWRR